MADTKASGLSLRTLDFLRFGFFGLAVMAVTVFMSGVVTNEIPSLAEETFFVNSTDDADDGQCDEVHCSLREALGEANYKINGEGIDRIYFEIEGDGPHVIVLKKPLPIITDPIVIDATTNPGYEDAPIIEISGNDSVRDGFVITGGETTIQGFILRDFRGAGVYMSGYGGNRIQGNYICTDASGSKPSANAHGILIENGAGNMVGGPTEHLRNIISGCERTGVYISGADAKENYIHGNDIGLSSRDTPLPSPIGILFEDASGNFIGGSTTGEQNRIYQKDVTGILMTGSAEGTNLLRENVYID